jgi:putative acetyltransferase
VEIRPAAPADREAVAAVQEAAFGDEGPLIVRLLDALEDSGAMRAQLVAAAATERGEAAVGHVALSRGWLDAEQELVEVLVLSPLGVLPEWQHGGVGTALVAAALDRAAGLGVPAVFLEGSPDYYGARGFQGAGRLGFDRPSVRVPGQAFQVALLPAYHAWMTGRLVYPEAFWALDCVGLRGEALRRLRETLED